MELVNVTVARVIKVHTLKKSGNVLARPATEILGSVVNAVYVKQQICSYADEQKSVAVEQEENGDLTVECWGWSYRPFVVRKIKKLIKTHANHGS